MSNQFRPLAPLPAELRPSPGPTGREVLVGIDRDGRPHLIDLSAVSQKTARKALYGLWRYIDATGGVSLRSPQLLALVGDLDPQGGKP